MFSVFIAKPFEDELRRYGSDYTDLSDCLFVPEMELYDIVLNEIELLDVDWNDVPVQFISTFERVFTDDEGNRIEFDRPRVISRGWCRDRTDVFENIPNYDPDVLMFADWFDDHEPDWKLFACLQFLDRPEFSDLKNAALLARLRG
jgi:hypothetical protein